MVCVPDASNHVADNMIIASLEAGVSSNAAKSIMEAIGVDGNKVVVGVAGSSTAVNVATLKRALNDFMVKVM